MRKTPRVAKVRLVPKPEVARYPTALHNLAERLGNGVHLGSSDVSPAIRQPHRVDDLARRMPPLPHPSGIKYDWPQSRDDLHQKP